MANEELLQEQFTARSLGTSPLASRTLRQQELARVRSLRGEIQTSRATRAEMERQRTALSQIRNTIRASARGGGVGGTGSLGVPPNFVLRIAPSFQKEAQTLPGRPLPTGGPQLTPFTITGAQEGGQTNIRFSSPEELEQFLKRNPEVAQSLVVQSGVPITEATRLAGVSPQLAQQLQAIPRVGFTEAQRVQSAGLGRGGISSIPQSGRAAREALAQRAQARGPQTAREGFKAIRAGKTLTNQNLRASVTDAGFRQIQALHASTDEVESNLFKATQQAQREGRLSEHILQLIKQGIITEGF